MTYTISAFSQWLMLMISICRFTESQYWKMALWANFFHNLLICCPPPSPPPKQAWVICLGSTGWWTGTSSLLPLGVSCPQKVYALLCSSTNLAGEGQSPPLGNGGAAPGQCYLCLSGEICLIRRPIYLLIQDTFPNICFLRKEDDILV